MHERLERAFETTHKCRRP